MLEANNEGENLTTHTTGLSLSSPSINYVTYITTNDLTGQQYLGVFSFKDNNRRDAYKYQYYIGNGVIHKDQAAKMKQSEFTQNVIEYGYENFTREDLLITTNKEEAYQLEADLCNVDWINNPKTLNNRTGGNKNVKASRATGKRISEAKLKNHPTAIKCLDSTTGIEYKSISQCAKAINMDPTTLSSQLKVYKDTHFIKLIK